MDRQPDQPAPDIELRPIDQALGEVLGQAIAAIEPWSVLNFQAHHITSFLTSYDPAVRCTAAMAGDEPAGAIGVHLRWLRGPYLQTLAVLPPFQGMGIGAKLLEWFEAQATPADRWLWMCCSTFNARAAGFYEAHGYERVATLTGLVVDGLDEFLMRKRNVHFAP